MRPGLWLVCWMVLAPLAPAARADDAAAASVPTWHGEVQAIFQRRCQACHREGQAGPFPLVTREDVQANAETIAEVVRERRMPPWHADPAVGQWVNDRRLSDGEQRAVLDWIAGGQPAGDPARAPAPPQWPAEGWHMQPDAIIEMPRPFKVPATGVVQYQYFDVPTDFGEDRWIESVEVRVGAPAVVHHVLLFLKYPDGSEPRLQGGLRGYFASGLPGDMVMPFPEGTAKLLPRGATIRFQLHYTPNGTAAEDLTKVGLKFAEPLTVRRELRTESVFAVDFRIPPRVPAHEVSAKRRFKEDTVLFGLLPHMHLRGKAFTYTLREPDGRTEVLLAIPQYDFNWQNGYRLAKPRFIPKGSVIEGVAVYDNSEANLANPDPSRDVGFGEQTWDEMMIGYMDVATATAEERAAWEAERR